MAEIKTKATEDSVDEFLDKIEADKKRAEAKELKDIFDELLEYKAVLWGNNIIGYGSYHYKSDRSTQEGDWPLVGFAPRKQDLTVYIMPGISRYEDLIEKIGKVKISKGSCLYIKSLKDIDRAVLKELILKSVEDMKSMYPRKEEILEQ